MKRFLAFSILLAALSSTFVGAISWAKEDIRAGAYGDDPNHPRPSAGPRKELVEAEAGVMPYCETCVRRLIDKAIHEETNHARHPVGYTPEPTSTPDNSQSESKKTGR